MIIPLKFSQVVVHVPEEMLPFQTTIPGRIRFRFRSREVGKVFIKSETGIREFIIGVEDGHWFPSLECGRNERRAA